MSSGQHPAGAGALVWPAYGQARSLVCDRCAANAGCTPCASGWRRFLESPPGCPTPCSPAPQHNTPHACPGAAAVPASRAELKRRAQEARRSRTKSLPSRCAPPHWASVSTASTADQLHPRLNPPPPPLPTTQWSARRPPCALQPEPQRRVSLLAARGEEEEEEGQCQARPQVPVCSLAVPSPGPPSPLIVA